MKFSLLLIIIFQIPKLFIQRSIMKKFKTNKEKVLFSYKNTW
jgi:hypothetical protein